MTLAFRPYQTTAIERLRAASAEGATRLLLVAPTGFGKTLVFSTCALGHLDVAGPDARVLVVAHRRELVRQTVVRLRACGLDRVGVLQADTDAPDESARVVVASQQTLAARGERPRATMVIWDEAHHVVASTFRTVASAYPDALHLGATATPGRGDDAPLGDMFDALIVGATVRELAASGHLVRSDVVAPPSVSEHLWQKPVAAYQAHAAGTPAVVFAANIAHARALADEFTAAGYRAACVDGKTAMAQRDTTLGAFHVGLLDVITNVFCLTEGWDAPRAATCIVARTCTHVGTWLQMVGRVLRPAPGKTGATVIDLKGAVYNLGLPDEDRVWSLTGKPKRTETMIALRHCTSCLAIFRPVTRCPRCGAAAKTATRMPRVLNRVERMERLSHLTPAQIDARQLRQLYWVAENRMHKRGEEIRQTALWLFEKRKKRRPIEEAAAE